MPREWDASTYQRVSRPQEEMGRAVLERLPLEGDETVLDAGCGTGRVTALLLERLPRGRVIGVDGSAAMVEEARRRLVDPRVSFERQDLLELSLAEPVDAILSTATFHWILDHERLFARLRAVLRPGGRLVAQCGGQGNVEEVKAAGNAVATREPFAEHFDGWVGPWYFASPEETEPRVLAAGFSEARCWGEEIFVEPDDALGYLGAICLGAHLEQLPAELHDEFVRASLAELGSPLRIRYVRLNIDARA